MSSKKISKLRIRMIRDIDEEIEDFLESINDLWAEEPLDGDETREIANKVLRELDQINGND